APTIAIAAAETPVEWLTIDPSNPRAVDPREALGAGIDGMEKGEVARLFTRHNIRRMLAAGLGPVSYRLRTELGIEAWHWSEEGSWSDPGRRQGYWTSTSRPRRPVLTGWGYALPRRGDTIDQAANHGFSRLDDGDRATFWKSNPWLDPAFTHERARPQWVVVDLGAPSAIDTARIVWATPFATRYRVQYWIGADEYDDQGCWTTFAGGTVNAGAGGEARLALATRPVTARYLRILLIESSRTAPPGASDRRDRMGFAIAEVAFGATGAGGVFVDAVRHAADRDRQSAITVSSTDPWHRAADRDPDLEQPGFDRLFASGLTRGLPVMIPVGALYDTPENAAAEIRFLARRGYPVRQVEIGEEPDGQNVSPEDYGALYRLFARAVRAANPRITVGGPSLQSAVSDTWLDDNPDHSWTRRFVGDLKAHGAADDLGFFTFEHYPFDDLCQPAADLLRRETAAMGDDLARLKADTVPTGIPWIISEYGFSAFGGRLEVEVPGGLVDADIAARFLSLGGHAAYLFGYGPNRPFAGGRPCAGSGNLMLLEADQAWRARWPMPAFFSMRMLARDWLVRGDANRISGPVATAGGLVTAYPARRPDGRWSVLLINRDAKAAHRVRMVVRSAASLPPVTLNGPFAVTQYGAGRYAWRPGGETGRPVLDLPPRRFRLAGAGEAIALPPFSLTIVTQDRVAGLTPAPLPR
ncbi:MAG: discoidin domain-containing protein, partial [Caulobacteraceae bacterium]